MEIRSLPISFSYAMIITVLSLLAVLQGCGNPANQRTDSETLADDRNSASFGISIDSDGNFGFGLPQRRELQMDLNGVRGTKVDRTDTSKTFGSQKEAIDEKLDTSDPDPKDCFVYEAGRTNYGNADGKPQIRAPTKIEIANETYRDLKEAEESFGKQIADAKNNLAGAWQSAKASTDSLKSIVKSAAMAHNSDIHRTLSIAEDVIGSSGRYISEFKTSPLTSAGARLVKASKDLATAWKELPTKFSGEQLEKRSALLKDAGNFLKLADAFFVEGDMESGEYMTNVAQTLIDVTVSYLPLISWAKDIQEAVSGYSLIYNRPLDATERTFAVIGAVTGGIGSKVLTTGKALKALNRFFITSKTGQAALDAVQKAGQILGA